MLNTAATPVEPLHGRCVSCASFRASNERGFGHCIGNAGAFKEMTGKSFSAGAPEGPSFRVRKLDGCSLWRAGAGGSHG